MNWKRIWIGAVIAGATLWFSDLGLLVLSQRLLVSEPNLMWAELGPIAISLLLPNAVMGFLLSWLYALARPRLGPGPLTALIMGSIGFAFANNHFFSVTVFMSSVMGALVQIVIAWFKFALATYLAGWQYIEQAPE